MNKDINQSEKVVSPDDVSNQLNKMIDERVKKILSQYQLPTFKCAIVDSINSDNTVNLKLAGQTTVTQNYPNYSKYTLSAGDSVWICSLNGGVYDVTNSFVAYKFSKNPPNIGYQGAYFDWQNGFVSINSTKTLKLVVNSSEEFSVYTGDGSGTNWTLMCQFGLVNSTQYGIGLYSNGSLVGQISTVNRSGLDGIQIGVPFNGSYNVAGTVYFDTNGCHLEGPVTFGTGDSVGYYNTLKTDDSGALNINTGLIKVNSNSTWSGSITYSSGHVITVNNGLITNAT